MELFFLAMPKTSVAGDPLVFSKFFSFSALVTFGSGIWPFVTTIFILEVHKMLLYFTRLKKLVTVISGTST